MAWRSCQNCEFVSLFAATRGYDDPKTGAEHLRKELAAANKAALALGEKPLDVTALHPDFRIEAHGDMNDANAAAVQNEPALAALIGPLDTPSQDTWPVRQKG